jgi:hypothetical protein
MYNAYELNEILGALAPLYRSKKKGEAGEHRPILLTRTEDSDNLLTIWIIIHRQVETELCDLLHPSDFACRANV